MLCYVISLLQELFKGLQTQITKEVERAKSEEARIESRLNAEINRAKAEERRLQGEIDDIWGADGKDTSHDITSIWAKLEELEEEGGDGGVPSIDDGSGSGGGGGTDIGGIEEGEILIAIGDQFAIASDATYVWMGWGVKNNKSLFDQFNLLISNAIERVARE